MKEEQLPGIILRRDTEKAFATGLAELLRLSDDAIKQEKVIIQGAQDFFAWAYQTQSSSKIKYLFVPTDECQESQQELAEKAEGLLRVPGTMKSHAVGAGGRQAVQVKDTS